MASTWQIPARVLRTTTTTTTTTTCCRDPLSHSPRVPFAPQIPAISSCSELPVTVRMRSRRICSSRISCHVSGVTSTVRKEQQDVVTRRRGGGFVVSSVKNGSGPRARSTMIAPGVTESSADGTLKLRRKFVSGDRCPSIFFGKKSGFCSKVRTSSAQSQSRSRSGGAVASVRGGIRRGAAATSSSSSESWLFDPLSLLGATYATNGPYTRNSQEQDLISTTVLKLIGGTRGPQKPGPAQGRTSPGGRGPSSSSMEDNNQTSFQDFFNGKLPSKFGILLAYLALSRLGVYIPLPGVDVAAFSSQIDQSGILGTLDTLSGGGIGRLGIFSLGIVPFINAQIVFQLLSTLYPKLQDLQKKEGEAGRKKFLRYTQYAAGGFAFAQAIGQCLFIKPYVYDFDTQWFLSSAFLLTAGSLIVMWIGEQITELKIGNGTSLLIFTNILSYLPASFGRTVQQAIDDGNYLGLAAIIGGFLGLVFGIVYVQEAERKIPMNYASRFRADNAGLGRSSYLPFKVNSAGVMPIIFSSSLLAAPASLARFTGIAFLRNAAIALNPTGPFYLPTNVALIAFFNYFYTFLQLEPSEVSEQLKRQGASIPSVRPGRATATYITNVLTRLSILGSLFLGFLALSPALVESVTHLQAFRGFAGTSILILVGCATDSARKVEAELVSQKYRPNDDKPYL